MLFATFRYFQLYFFNMYCIIIFLGLANGLILLPIVLSLVGPPPLRAVSLRSVVLCVRSVCRSVSF